MGWDVKGVGARSIPSLLEVNCLQKLIAQFPGGISMHPPSPPCIPVSKLGHHSIPGRLWLSSRRWALSAPSLSVHPSLQTWVSHDTWEALGLQPLLGFPAPLPPPCIPVSKLGHQKVPGRLWARAAATAFPLRLPHSPCIPVSKLGHLKVPWRLWVSHCAVRLPCAPPSSVHPSLQTWAPHDTSGGSGSPSRRWALVGPCLGETSLGSGSWVISRTVPRGNPTSLPALQPGAQMWAPARRFTVLLRVSLRSPPLALCLKLGAPCLSGLHSSQCLSPNTGLREPLGGP